MSVILDNARHNLSQATEEGWLPKIQIKVWQTSDGVNKVRINKAPVLTDIALSVLVVVDLYTALKMRVKEVSKLNTFYHPDWTDMLFPEGEMAVINKINKFSHSLSKEEDKTYFFARQKMIEGIVDKSISFEELKNNIIQCYAPYEAHWDNLYDNSKVKQSIKP